MSYTAVYDVTRALRMLLHSQIVLRSPAAVVTLLPPGDTLPDVLGINLYLYRLTESPFTRNRAWPGDRATAPSDQPALGLQLSYLLTPLSTKPDDANFQLGDDAHTMLGVAMLTLQEHPVLNNVHLPGFDADTVLPDSLLNSYEQIKVHLTSTSVEELSKIWSTINKPYRLSVAYDVALVELTPTPPPPVRGDLVRSTSIAVTTLDPPRLTELIPPNGAVAQVAGNVVRSNDVQITGFGLTFPGQTPIIHVGGQLVSIKSTPAATDRALTVTLPTVLDAGPQVDVRVAVNSRTSLPLSFNVNPWLSNLTPLRTALDPLRGPTDLKLTLQGSGFTASPQSVRLDGSGGTSSVTAFDAGGEDTQATITLPPTLANGIYDARLVLPNANTSNPRSLEVIPRLDSPIVVAAVAGATGTVHQLTLNGARLNGGDVRLVIDGVIYQVGPNNNPSPIIYTLGRLLSAGTHRVSVNVDGHLSRSVDLEV